MTRSVSSFIEGGILTVSVISGRLHDKTKCFRDCHKEKVKGSMVLGFDSKIIVQV